MYFFLPPLTSVQGRNDQVLRGKAKLFINLKNKRQHQRKRLNILSQKSLGPNGLKIDDSRVYNKMLYFHVAGNYGLFPANYVEIIDNKELQVM